MKSFYQSTVNPAIKKLFGGVVPEQHLGMACRIHDRVVRGRQMRRARGGGRQILVPGRMRLFSLRTLCSFVAELI